MDHSWGSGMGQKAEPIIIGFGHEAQQGKDTVVAHLVEKYHQLGRVVKRYAFADALKLEVFDWLQGLDAIRNSHQFTPLILSDSETRFVVPSPYRGVSYGREEKLAWIEGSKQKLRPLLQFWGTEYRRHQNRHYWVAQTLQQIVKDQPQFALISDMRFLNETQICDVTVRVVRKGKLDQTAGKTHASESELDSFNYGNVLVAEDGDLEGLKKSAEGMFEYVLKNKGLLP